MKKIICIALITLASFCLCAQNTNKTQKSNTTSQSTSVQQKSSTSSTKSSTATTSNKTSSASSTAAKSGSTATQSSSTTKSSSTAKSSGTSSSTAKSGSTAKSSSASSTNSSSSNKQKQQNVKQDDNKDFYSKLRFGATGGMGIWMGPKPIFQIRAGADARMPFLLPHAYLMAGSRLSLRGCDPTPFPKLSTLYLEIPARIGYTFPLGDNLALFGEAGPYLDVRLIRFARHDNSCARFLDFGLGADAGLELGHKIRLSLGLDFGFFRPCVAEHTINNGLWLTGTYLF